MRSEQIERKMCLLGKHTLLFLVAIKKAHASYLLGLIKKYIINRNSGTRLVLHVFTSSSLYGYSVGQYMQGTFQLPIERVVVEQ